MANRIPDAQERNDQIRSLLIGLDSRIPGEDAHAQRVAVYATATGFELGLRGADLLVLKEAALLHDLGKASLPSELHERGRVFSEAEKLAIRQHTVLAEAALEAIDWLRPAIPAVLHHHERWDGSGYPDGLAGDNIPLAARIIGLAEAFDAMLRPAAGEPKSEEIALAEIEQCAGRCFDPEVVAAFLRVQPLIQPLDA